MLLEECLKLSCKTRLPNYSMLLRTSCQKRTSTITILLILYGVSETGAQSFTGEITTTSRVTLLGAPGHCAPLHYSAVPLCCTVLWQRRYILVESIYTRVITLVTFQIFILMFQSEIHWKCLLQNITREIAELWKLWCDFIKILAPLYNNSILQYNF